MSRRRAPVDLASARRSRSSFSGAITRAKDQLLAIRPLPIVEYNKKTIDRLLLSITTTETRFFQNLEDTQAFIQEEESPDDHQLEEEEAGDAFSIAIMEVRDLAEELLGLKAIQAGLEDFKSDLAALRDLFSEKPDDNHNNALLALESNHSALRNECRKADISREHPLKVDLETCRTLLTRLNSELATQKESRDTASVSSASSHHSSPSPFIREEEGKLPSLDLPTFNGNIMEWSTFWASFSSTIGTRRLSNTNKLTYLRKAIKDPESQTLMYSPSETPDFYLEVVKNLQARFNRTKEIHRQLVNKLILLPPVKAQRTDLRRRVDSIKHILSSLQHTGHYELTSFLTSLVYLTLPVKLQTLWEQNVKKIKGVSPIEDLLVFISEHAETLPATPASPASTPPSAEKKLPKRPEKKQDNRQRPAVHAVTQSTNYRWDCILCKPEKHPLYSCSKWLGFSLQQRLAQIQSKKLCSNCLSVGHPTESCKSTYRCRDCGLNHHTTIHQPSPSLPAAPPVTVNSATVQQAPIQDSLMMTAQVLLTGPGGHTVRARAFIDPGAAMSLISSKIAQRLRLPLTKTQLQFSAVLNTPCKSVKHITNLSISPLQGGPLVAVRAAVVPKVTGDIPAKEIDPVDNLPHLVGLGLADPTFYLPGKIDILLGSEVYPQLMVSNPLITGAASEPAAQETIFGWAIIGPVKSKGSYILPIPANSVQILSEEEGLDSTLNNFFTSGEVEPPPTPISLLEQQVEDMYLDTVVYNSINKRYTVSLPWKLDAPPLGDSRSQALQRYISNERSILRRNIWKPFQDVVQGYVDLGHAEIIPAYSPIAQQTYYLPMHGVFKESSTSTKLRVVFDGSALTTSGHSLNQSLMVGPTLHPSLERILLKFRTYPVALTADIAKMYREVELVARDRDFHRFLWRPDPQQEIRDYRMTRVTFGISASPYLAVRTLQQTAVDHGQGHPEAAQHIGSSFYVDDLLAGANSVEAALQLYSDLREVLQHGGFNLCKWRSSHPEVLSEIPVELQEALPVKEVTQIHSQPKALGLEWNSSTDQMSPSIPKTSPHTPTKRGVVSNVSKTFDVLGWISPSILVMKMLFQQFWQLSTGWDEELPHKLLQLHCQWKEELPLLAQKQLARNYYRPGSVPLTRELHCFSDASKKACGAVIYVRSTYADEPPLVSLVTSKTKVAKLIHPDKPQTTIPRQELCGALLLTQMLSSVKSALDIPDGDVHAWTDSSIILAWLDGHPRDFKPFVANRVHSILQATSPSTWMHVPTAQNPADCASRGLMPSALLNYNLWWEGPAWLLEDPIIVPKQPPRKPIVTPENRVTCNVLQVSPPPLVETWYSNYHKLLAMTAWILRFYHKLNHTFVPDPGINSKLLSAKEIKQAEIRLVLRSQDRSFSAEKHSLSLGHQVPNHSKLLSLTPFLDRENLIRVGGRLKNSCLSLSQSHLIILNSTDILITLMFNYFHVCLGHCGPSLLLCYIGNKYHVVGARRLSRQVCRSCTICKKITPKVDHQLMGDLPQERVTFTPAFTVTGMDFAGPFTIKMGHVRKPVPLVAHICIFVCFSTKAVHLEVLSSQTTQALLACLDRFTSRRNCPQVIYSDNGPAYVGAKNILKQLYTFLRSEDTSSEVHQHLLRQQVEWNTIPARSPHFGGLWEAAVRSMKYHLRRVVGPQKLTFEELQTVACKVEACLNSRPLLATTSHDPDGLTTLTAGHFLTFKEPVSYPHDPRMPKEPSLLRNWEMCQSLCQHFWQRWSQEYLHTLQSRTKWQKIKPNLQQNDIVILKDAKTFSCHWPLARVLKTYPGKDGLVRVVTIKTSTGTYKRPTAKLALLTRPQTSDADAQRLPPGVCLDTNPPDDSPEELQQPLLP